RTYPSGDTPGVPGPTSSTGAARRFGGPSPLRPLPAFPRSVALSDVPARGAAAGVPRHVLALVLMVVAVLGFAVGGSLHAALASPLPAQSKATLVAASAAKPPSALTAGAKPVAAHRGRALPGGPGDGRRIVYQES